MDGKWAYILGYLHLHRYRYKVQCNKLKHFMIYKDFIEGEKGRKILTFTIQNTEYEGKSSMPDTQSLGYLEIIFGLKSPLG